jgi:uncharacterized protein with NRDE domain
LIIQPSTSSPFSLAVYSPRRDDNIMCVVTLALHQHPDWPVLLLGNRDEFHGRASDPLHAWSDGSGIVAGRDAVGGGTWLGVQPALARLVVVTNVRSDDGPDPAKLSRGLLVRDQLTGAGSFAAPPLETLDRFNGFSLLRLDGDSASLLTNRPKPAEISLQPGIHALANQPFAATCPRAARLADAVKSWLSTGNNRPAALLDILADKSEPALFLRSDIYGTRCSTLVAIDRRGQGRITERRYAKGGIPLGETALDFRVGS